MEVRMKIARMAEERLRAGKKRNLNSQNQGGDQFSHAVTNSGSDQVLACSSLPSPSPCCDHVGIVSSIRLAGAYQRIYPFFFFFARGIFFSPW